MTQNKSQVLAHGTIDAAFRHEERERESMNYLGYPIENFQIFGR